MIKKIGRLTKKDEDEIYLKTNNVLGIYQESPKKGIKKLDELSSCPNYFGRENIAKICAYSDDKDEIAKVMKKYLDSRVYAKRATALFFFYYYYKDEPEKMIDIVSNYYDSIKWEAENIIDHFWKDYPNLMKNNMLKWIESNDEQKRSLSFHGLENFCFQDPQFVMEFIEKIIDDNSIEVQKKITHTLIQIARSRPADIYPYIREWLTNADDKRVKTIWVSMKKLANSLKNYNKKEKKNNDFVILTKDTIKNWKSDRNRKVSTMGDKLYHILRKQNIS